jgi:putative oxidoreductase
MKNKIFNIVSALFGLLLINGGLNKFFNYLPVPENLPEPLLKDSKALMEISWLMPLIATAELTGGLLILFPRTRAMGLLIVLPVMTGVLLTHLTVAPDGLIMALIIWIVIGWIIWEDRNKFLPLLR